MPKSTRFYYVVVHADDSVDARIISTALVEGESARAVAESHTAEEGQVVVACSAKYDIYPDAWVSTR